MAIVCHKVSRKVAVELNFFIPEGIKKIVH